MNDGGTLSREILRREGEALVIASPKKGGDMAKIEELKLEIAKAIFKHRWPEFEWMHDTDVLAWKVSWEIERNNCILLASKILKACAEAGLVFVDKDASMYKHSARGIHYSQDGLIDAQFKLLEDAGWKKTKEIEV